jgi:hypothetical protein
MEVAIDKSEIGLLQTYSSVFKMTYTVDMLFSYTVDLTGLYRTALLF